MTNVYTHVYTEQGGIFMPGTSIVRISNKAKQTLETLAEQSGETMSCVMDKAIEAYRRRTFLEQTNRAYARLRADEKASREFDQEIAAWDTTLMDGLDQDETQLRGKSRNLKNKGGAGHGGSPAR